MGNSRPSYKEIIEHCKRKWKHLPKSLSVKILAILKLEEQRTLIKLKNMCCFLEVIQSSLSKVIEKLQRLLSLTAAFLVPETGCVSVWRGSFTPCEARTARTRKLRFLSAVWRRWRWSRSLRIRFTLIDNRTFEGSGWLATRLTQARSDSGLRSHLGGGSGRMIRDSGQYFGRWRWCTSKSSEVWSVSFGGWDPRVLSGWGRVGGWGWQTGCVPRQDWHAARDCGSCPKRYSGWFWFGMDWGGCSCDFSEFLHSGVTFRFGFQRCSSSTYTCNEIETKKTLTGSNQIEEFNSNSYYINLMHTSSLANWQGGRACYSIKHSAMSHILFSIARPNLEETRANEEEAPEGHCLLDLLPDLPLDPEDHIPVLIPLRRG